MALRPKTLSATVIPITVGTALARADGGIVLWWASVCALASAACIQIGTNFINDALDFRSGADDDRRIGPKRATQSGLLTERQVLAGGFICFALAAALGLPLVIEGGWVILVIGLVSLVCGYAYTGGPYPLAYKGLGDLFVILFFGLVATGGTFWLHTKAWGLDALVAGLQVGCLGTVLIAINNLRDSPLDALVDKRTLAVRFGPAFARAEIAALSFLPFVLGAWWLSLGKVEAALLPLIALPLAWIVVSGVWRNEPSPIYNRFLAQAAGLQMAFGLALAVGLAFG